MGEELRSVWTGGWRDREASDSQPTWKEGSSIGRRKCSCPPGPWPPQVHVYTARWSPHQVHSGAARWPLRLRTMTHCGPATDKRENLAQLPRKSDCPSILMPKACLPTPWHFRLSGRCVEGDPAAANGGAKASVPGTLLSAASIIFNLRWPKG